jgi:hypothetical protein
MHGLNILDAPGEGTADNGNISQLRGHELRHIFVQRSDVTQVIGCLSSGADDISMWVMNSSGPRGLTLAGYAAHYRHWGSALVITR